jgi:hypothetical protein
MSKTLTLLALPDNLLEGTETFSIVLSNPTNGAQLGAIKTSLGLIDDPTFIITGSGPVSEGGVITFTVSRLGDAPLPQTVEYSRVDGTAVTGGSALQGTQDYLAPSGTLTFSQGETVKTITVNVVDDPIFDDTAPETFSIVLSNPTAGSTTTGVARHHHRQ